MLLESKGCTCAEVPSADKCSNKISITNLIIVFADNFKYKTCNKSKHNEQYAVFYSSNGISIGINGH